MNSKYPALKGSSKATDILKEMQRTIRENRLQPGRNTRIVRGPGGTIVTANPAGTQNQGGEAVWL